MHLQNTLYCLTETHPQSWSKQPPWAEYPHNFLVKNSIGLPHFRPAIEMAVKPSGRRCGKPCYGPNIPINFLPTLPATPPPSIPQVSLSGYSPRTFLCESHKLATRFIGWFTVNKTLNLSMVKLNPPNHVHIYQARWSSSLFFLRPGLCTSKFLVEWEGYGPREKGTGLWVFPTGSFSSSLFAFPGRPWLALLLTKHILFSCHHSTWSISALINCSIKAYSSLHSLPVYCQAIVVNQALSPKELRIFRSFFDWSYKTEFSCGFNYLVFVVPHNIFPLFTKNLR